MVLDCFLRQVAIHRGQGKAVDLLHDRALLAVAPLLALNKLELGLVMGRMLVGLREVGLQVVFVLVFEQSKNVGFASLLHLNIL